MFLLYRHGYFTEKYTTRKIHKNYIRDPSGLFSIISHVSLSMISLISSVSQIVLKFAGVSSKHLRVFHGSLRQSSDIFGKSRKMFGNVRLVFGTILENLRKSSEASRKSGKSSKTPSSACLYDKKNITRRLEDMNFIFEWQKQYFTHSLRSFVKYCFATRK